MSGFSSNFPNDSLNHDVYLNHLPAPEAKEMEISRNILVAVLGATIWDILAYIPDDIKIISRSDGFSFVILFFVLSRISAIVYVILGSMAHMTPIYNIHAFEITSTCFLALSDISSSYLFLRRAQAVFVEHKCIRIFFFISWLVLFGVSWLGPAGLCPFYIPGTYYYRGSSAKIYVAAIPWVVLAFDTTIFMTISYKLAKEHSIPTNDGEEHKAGWSTMLSGRRLPQLSKAVLRGGQQYYLISVGTIILRTIGTFTPEKFPVISGIGLRVSVPLVASMACRIFRNLKLLELDPQMLGLPTISSS